MTCITELEDQWFFVGRRCERFDVTATVVYGFKSAEDGLNMLVVEPLFDVPPSVD